MKEVFYEESATIQNVRGANAKYNTIKAFSIISYVIAVIWVIIGFNTPLVDNFLINLIVIGVPIIIFLVTGILLGRLKNKFYVDYDYTFVTGSIRISKVIKNIKRKFVIKFDTDNVERIGKYGSDTFYKYEIMPGIKKHVFTSNYVCSEGKDFYYLVANVEGDKHLMTLECTETFIVNILKFSNKTVLEEEFYKK